jgi:acyl-CoA hydrolase
VTLYLGGLHFLRPIRVGEIVELRSLVIHTGRTSLHIAIDIYARDPKSPTLTRAGHCVIVFVALDEKGRPKAVPSWSPVTDTDRALQAYALRLVELRKLMDSELEAHLAMLERSTADSVSLSG